MYCDDLFHWRSTVSGCQVDLLFPADYPRAPPRIVCRGQDVALPINPWCPLYDVRTLLAWARQALEALCAPPQ